jgi:hypothetical protein
MHNSTDEIQPRCVGRDHRRDLPHGMLISSSVGEAEGFAEDGGYYACTPRMREGRGRERESLPARTVRPVVMASRL